MSSVQEPTLFVWIFLPKANQVEVENKTVAFASALKLPAVTPTATKRESVVEKIALGLGNYKLIEHFKRTSPQGAECLLHAYHDAFIIQIAISKDTDWTGSFLEGFNDLTKEFKGYWQESPLIEEKPYGSHTEETLYGISAVYWAITGDAEKAEPSGAEIQNICGRSDPTSVSNDLGRLWRSEYFLFTGLEVSQDLWMLVTPRSTESEVNRRFNQRFHDAPPTFATMAVAAHKIRYEELQHAMEFGRMESQRQGIDCKVSDALRTQLASGSKLENLRSLESEKLGRQLAEATAALADYRSSLYRLKRIRQTIAIARRNYLVNGVELISRHGTSQVERSDDWEKSAVAFLSRLEKDEILVPELGRIQAILEQLDSDIDYSGSVYEAHTASLHAVSDRLRIAGELHLGEMAHHLSIDSAAVVASIFAIIATDIVLKGKDSSPAAWFLSAFLITGSFGATQILSSRWRGGWVERASLALAGGSLACYLTLEFGSPWRFSATVLSDIWRLLVMMRTTLLVAVFVVGFFLVAFLHWLGAKRRIHT